MRRNSSSIPAANRGAANFKKWVNMPAGRLVSPCLRKYSGVTDEAPTTNFLFHAVNPRTTKSLITALRLSSWRNICSSSFSIPEPTQVVSLVILTANHPSTTSSLQVSVHTSQWDTSTSRQRHPHGETHIVSEQY